MERTELLPPLNALRTFDVRGGAGGVVAVFFEKSVHQGNTRAHVQREQQDSSKHDQPGTEAARARD